MSAGSPVPGMLENAKAALKKATDWSGPGHASAQPSYTQAHQARGGGLSHGAPVMKTGGVGTTGSPVPTEEATSIKSKIDNAKAAGLSDQ
jgi:hypothetical protein